MYKYKLKQVSQRKTIKKCDPITIYAKEIVVVGGDKGAECEEKVRACW